MHMSVGRFAYLQIWSKGIGERNQKELARRARQPWLTNWEGVARSESFAPVVPRRHGEQFDVLNVLLRCNRNKFQLRVLARLPGANRGVYPQIRFWTWREFNNT